MSFEEQITSKGKYPGIFSNSNIFRNKCSSENWEIFRDVPSLSWRLFGHVARLDQPRASENI